MPIADSSDRVLSVEGLARLVDAVRAAGHRVVGPTARDGAIVLDELSSAEELPTGWTDAQGPGTYRLTKTDSPARFNHRVGPHAPRRFLQSPRHRLFRTEGAGRSLRVIADAPPAEKTALLGVRSCDLAAIAIQDRVLSDDEYVDAHYVGAREDNFIIAVHCTQPGEVCFCVSTDTGPRAQSGFDLALTELAQDGEVRYLVEVGSPQGRAVLDDVPTEAADPDTRAEADRLLLDAAQNMGRALDAEAVPGALERTLNSTTWDEIADRCLACANCTLVCPTCFCTTVDDVTSLDGAQAERWQQWDSCFHAGHSYMHGGPVRRSTRARYRQWLVHKLSSWVEQFGSSGCTGCGRCITWCPVGIDITVEAQRFVEEDAAAAAGEGT